MLIVEDCGRNLFARAVHNAIDRVDELDSLQLLKSFAKEPHEGERSEFHVRSLELDAHM